jgi:hypothetical protein
MVNDNLTKEDLDNKNKWREVLLNDLIPGNLYAILYPFEPVLIKLRIISKVGYDAVNNTDVNYIEMARVDNLFPHSREGLFPAGGLNRLKFYEATEAWKAYGLSRELMAIEKSWANKITDTTGRIPGDKDDTTKSLRERGIVDNIASYLGGNKTKGNGRKTRKKRRRVKSRRRSKKR